MMLFFRPIHQVAHISRAFNRAAVSAQRIFEVLDAEPEIFSKRDAKRLPEMKGRIELRNVSFSYDGVRRVLHNIDLTVKERGEPLEDDISNVVSYEKVVDLIKEIVGTGHVHLVETLAEMIAARCLENDWITGVRVRVEKPDIIAEARSVGVEIERLRST